MISGDRFMSACRRKIDLIVGVVDRIYNRVNMRSARAHACLLGCIAMIASCGGGSDAPCMSTGAMSDVLPRAQLVRLDVYDASAHCDGARVADGAPPPSLSKSATAG